MRRIGRVVAWGLAGLAVATLVWLLAGFVAPGYVSREPFFERDGEHVFDCYLDRDHPAEAFWVTFSKGGTQALVRFRDREATLMLQRGGLTGDVYQGAGMKLKLGPRGMTLRFDPEAQVTGHFDRSIGPCQTQ